MSRALLVLLVGIAGALLAALLLTPGAMVVDQGFVLVVLTIAAGGVVMAVTARRAALRDRARQLERSDDRDHVPVDVTAPGTTDDRPSEQEPDRG